MRYRGVVYDVGLNFNGDGLSIEPFNPEVVRADIRSIARDLHANAVRIEGEKIDRLETTARLAHEQGMTVFFNPWKMHVSADETRAHVLEAAETAERLRQDGVDIVFVVGCEYTIFGDGIFPGSGWAERGAWLGEQFASADHSSGTLPQSLLDKAVELNEVLRSFVAVTRTVFQGPVTYSAGNWEAVDWSAFDMVGLDYYRHGEPEEQYVGGLERFRLNKPLIVMEVGCCTYEGAAAKGDWGFTVLEGVAPDGSGIFQGGVTPTRSETEQADYIQTQVETLASAGVDGVFAFVFSFPSLKTGEGAKDMDLISFSLVKHFAEDDPHSKQVPAWVPKESFNRLASVYRRLAEAKQQNT